VHIAVKRGSINALKTGVLCVLFSEEQAKQLRKSPKSHFGKEITYRIPKGEFSGLEGQHAVLHLSSMQLHVFGLGPEKDITHETIRKAGGSMANQALCLKRSKFMVSLDVPKVGAKESARALTEGLVLGAYRFDKYKKKEKDGIHVQHVTLYTASKEKGLRAAVKDAEITCTATNYVRDLQMENADVATPLYLEKQARALAKKHNLKITVCDEPMLRRLGAGLLLAVAKGSAYPARLIILEHRGAPTKKEKTAIVGKGITFDTGGLNLKPTKFIETMREDMSGAAVVLGTMQAVASLKLKKNVVGVLAVAENAIGSRAYKPGDVYTSMSGITVEIGNTDAEGRLALADALTYVETKIKPTQIVDVATLTGAVIVALGDHVAGITGMDHAMIHALQDAGEKTFERVWPLPLYKEYVREVKSSVADINNINYGRKAGCIMGAAFLSKFVTKTPWSHIDIAGTSWLETSRNYYKEGATGFGVRLLVEWLR